MTSGRGQRLPPLEKIPHQPQLPGVTGQEPGDWKRQGGREMNHMARIAAALAGSGKGIPGYRRKPGQFGITLRR